MSSLRSGTGKSSPRSISLAPMEGYVPRVVQAIAEDTREAMGRECFEKTSDQ